jgi:hypothetical protein
VQGKPFKVSELVARIEEQIDGHRN